jgi:hypothetical protein
VSEARRRAAGGGGDRPEQVPDADQGQATPAFGDARDPDSEHDIRGPAKARPATRPTWVVGEPELRLYRLDQHVHDDSVDEAAGVDRGEH